MVSIDQSNEANWYRKLEELRVFFETNCRRPSPASRNERERLLEHWILQQSGNRQERAQGRRDIRVIWDEFKNEHINAFNAGNNNDN